MTSNAYIQMLRDYAALARRRNLSYSEAVGVLVQARRAYIRSQHVSSDTEGFMLSAAAAAAEREYGKFDASFTVPPDA